MINVNNLYVYICEFQKNDWTDDQLVTQVFEWQQLYLNIYDGVSSSSRKYSSPKNDSVSKGIIASPTIVSPLSPSAYLHTLDDKKKEEMRRRLNELKQLHASM